MLVIAGFPGCVLNKGCYVMLTSIGRKIGTSAAGPVLRLGKRFTQREKLFPRTGSVTKEL
jgi:hypothetical protein